MSLNSYIKNILKHTLKAFKQDILGSNYEVCLISKEKVVFT